MSMVIIKIVSVYKVMKFFGNDESLECWAMLYLAVPPTLPLLLIALTACFHKLIKYEGSDFFYNFKKRSISAFFYEFSFSSLPI